MIPRTIPITLALLPLVGSLACGCERRADGARGSSETSPRGEYGVPEEALRPSPKLDALLTKRVTIPDTRWTARTPETWICSSNGPRTLSCRPPDGRATRVDWRLERKPASASLKELMTSVLKAHDGPLTERKVVRGNGLTGVLVQKTCRGTQCLEVPLLVLYGPDTETGRDELTMAGDCDRTDCDVPMTIAVMYSSRRAE